MRRLLRAVGIGTVMALGSAAACSNYGSDCNNNRDCGPAVSGGTGGNAGDASAGTGAGGSTNSAGVSAGGSSGSGGSSGGGDGEQAGMSPGGASDGGAGGSAPCDGACGGATPVCDETSNKCVECVDKAQCAAPTPACDTTTKACAECTENPDCTDSAKAFCDTTAERCVACLQQSDCKDAGASKCAVGGACVPCTIDAECSNIAGKGVCDAGTCVQCTGKKFTACGSSVGTPLVCDSLKRTCTTNKQNSSGLCQTCVSDAQCSAGKICVLDKFGTPAADVGYFCHWKKGDVADGAPADCFATGRPYAGTQTNVSSVDGVVSDICVLRSSTCIARNQFSSKDCKVANAPSDAACGFSPTKDSKCVPVPSSSADVCTMTCASNDDCPQFTCDTGASPAVCLLQ